MKSYLPCILMSQPSIQKTNPCWKNIFFFFFPKIELINKLKQEIVLEYTCCKKKKNKKEVGE